MDAILKQMEAIFQAGVEAVDPRRLILNCLSVNGNQLQVRSEGFEKTYDLNRFPKIMVIGAGKATARMARTVEEVLQDRITAGAIAVKYGHVERLERIDLIEAGHPIPDENGLKAARIIAGLADEAKQDTLVICLISGGGSALIPCPFHWEEEENAVRLDLADIQETTQALLRCGAGISEINCIRKHLSQLKGGRLASRIFPAASLNLILSDVVGDRLDAIASGPTTPDASTFADMKAIVDRHDLGSDLPPRVLQLLELGLAGRIDDTPDRHDPAFERTNHLLIGTNYLSLKAAAQKAESLGFDTSILSSQITGEAREVAKVYCGIGRHIAQHSMHETALTCLIAGGETTVTIKGDGKGGRNQEMALAFLAEMAEDPEATQGLRFLAASTDGNDGPTDAAGAFAWSGLLAAAEQKGLSIHAFLKRNDAYHFFDQTGHLLKTGPTNTNVCDIQILTVLPENGR